MKKYYPYPARIKPEFTNESYARYFTPLFMVGNDLYGRLNNSLVKTTDLLRSSGSGEEQYETIHEFGEGHIPNHGAMLENGDMFICTTSITQQSGEWFLIKPNGDVISIKQFSGYSEGRPGSGKLSLLDHHNEIVVVGTYHGGADAQYIYLSRDYGNTWKTIWDNPIGSAAHNQHVHGVAYDPYRNYIWAALGDHDNATLICSDDWGRTWKHYFKQTRNQFMNIVPLFDKIVLDTDISPDGVIAIPFNDNGHKPELDVERTRISPNLPIDKSPQFYSFALRPYVDQSSYPNTIIHAFGGIEFSKVHQPVVMSYDGVNNFEIHGFVDDVNGTQTTYVEGDIRIEYLVGKTTPDFTINGEDYGGHIIGRGWQYQSGSWNYGLINFKKPEWVLVE